MNENKLPLITKPSNKNNRSTEKIPNQTESLPEVNKIPKLKQIEPIKEIPSIPPKK